MWLVNTIAALREKRRALSGRVALVPTMGALHRGHLSLIDVARTLADHVIVTVFVNPTQFGAHEDLARYPRDLGADVKLCEAAGATGVFAPSVDEMYLPKVPACEVVVPAIAADLEGRCRPGHFDGVCRVVLKFFNICEPDLACFGRKDYQQLVIIQAMVADLHLDVAIAPCPTIREGDGLAMSSRNRFLDDDQRRHAIGLHHALREAESMVHRGEMDPAVVENAMSRIIRAHHMDVEYAALRHPMTLRALDSVDLSMIGSAVALVAGRMGSVRLLDNRVIEPV